jgi:hypothetical protein
MTQEFRTRRLDTGDTFPPLTIRMLGGETIKLPEDVAGNWCVVLFTRGHW